MQGDRPAWMVVNEVGFTTFSLCDNRHSVGQISHILCQRYGLPFQQVLSDVQCFISRLVQSGFLALSDMDQPAGISGERDFPLKKVDLHITENCNLRCRHCGVTDGSKRKDYLTTEQIFRIIDEAKEARAGSLNITGGEPILREDLPAILSYAARRIKTVLATNATLITEWEARLIDDLDLKIQISLDGPSESIHDHIRGKGAFARTMMAVDLLGKLGAQEKVSLCATVSKNNLDHIPSLLKLAQEKGISEVKFIPLQNMGTASLYWDELAPSSQDYAQFYSYLYQDAVVEFPELRINPGFQGFVLHHPPGQTSWCQIGQMLIIDAQGDIYPCPLLMEPPFRLGNVLEVDLCQAIESPIMVRTREMCLNRKSTIPQCRQCLWKNFCQGGCSGNVYRLKGTFQAVDDLCELRNRFYPQAIFSRAAQKAKVFSNGVGGEDEGSSSG